MIIFCSNSFIFFLEPIHLWCLHVVVWHHICHSFIACARPSCYCLISDMTLIDCACDLLSFDGIQSTNVSFWRVLCHCNVLSTDDTHKAELYTVSFCKISSPSANLLITVFPLKHTQNTPNVAVINAYLIAVFIFLSSKPIFPSDSGCERHYLFSTWYSSTSKNSDLSLWCCEFKSLWKCVHFRFAFLKGNIGIENPNKNASIFSILYNWLSNHSMTQSKMIHMSMLTKLSLIEQAHFQYSVEINWVAFILSNLW